LPRPGSGYVTVTIPKELYKAVQDKIESLKKNKIALEEYGEKLESVSRFMGFLFEQFLDSYNLNYVLERLGLHGGTLELDWPSKAFTELCGQMDWYKSTEWIRSDNHAETIGELEWPQTLKDRIKSYEQFKFEKILVISEDVWESPDTWRWVWKVFSIKNENPDREITILVTKEKAAREARVNEMFFDMGIYKVGEEQPIIGFLDHKHVPPQYHWRLDPDRCFTDSEKAFAELGKMAEPFESIITKMLSAHGFSKPLRETSPRDKNNP